MAKSAAIDLPSPPTIGTRKLHNLLPVSAQRRRRRRPQTGVVAGPSSGVLSLLATISTTSSTASGSPLTQPTPPPFLCPYIARDNYEGSVELSPNPVAETSAAAAALSTPTPTNHRKRGGIADKYVQGTDGIWRRVDRYTLYGSTVCSNCEPTTSPGSNDDDAVQPSTITSPSVAQSTDEFDATMPNGWKPQTKVDGSRVKVILTTSLVLAFVICMFMAAIIFWRRKKRRRHENDEELRLRRRRGNDVSEHQVLVEKEARVKQKLWARASARWKAGVRSSARRRRNRRLVTGVQTPSTQASSVSLHDMASPVPQFTSRSSSPGLSTPDLETRSTSSDRQAAQSTGHTISAPSPTNPESSPPAYIHVRSPTPNPSKLRSSQDPHTIGELSDPFSQPIHADEDRPEFSMDEVPIPYEAPYHTGHVATDDKTVLSQMVHMVSAPPAAADEGGSSSFVISVPVWHDEELEGIIDDTQHLDLPDTPSPPRVRRASFSSSPLFPAPPSKDKMAAPNFYDYPYSFEEDIGSLDPETEPSAPPFEGHGPSAPPLEDAGMVPSAPPLPDEPSPSAPDWHLEEDEQNSHDPERDQHLQPFPSTSVPVTVVGFLPSYRA